MTKLEEIKQRIEEEANRLGITVDRLVRPDMCPKSKVLRDCLEDFYFEVWIEAKLNANAEALVDALKAWHPHA